MVKKPPANEGDMRDAGSVPGSGRSPGGGHGNSLQYSCLENPMDRGGWWATFPGVAKSQTQLNRLSMHACMLRPWALWFPGRRAHWLGSQSDSGQTLGVAQ